MLLESGALINIWVVLAVGSMRSGPLLESTGIGMVPGSVGVGPLEQAWSFDLHGRPGAGAQGVGRGTWVHVSGPGSWVHGVQPCTSYHWGGLGHWAYRDQPSDCGWLWVSG